jgi:acyl phosphate:glycerol-3-phosphate acyltransferase
MTDPFWLMPLLMLAMGYVLGSIPFGLLLTRFGGAGDIRDIGSGNIGATNVLRTGRKGLAAATLLLDMAKGAAAVCIARAVAPELAMIGGVGAFLGHLFPVWLRFKGGKGVATLLGISLALDWRIGLVFALVWLGALGLSKRSSVGGMMAALSAPVAAWCWARDAEAVILLGLAIILIWKHSDNIRRLLDGTEPRVGGSKADAVA